ncbi:MAG: FtsQ-type POTRA domain-containing protein [Magnetococcales bacterium]|nr:FtsQ-type POTRA domain-containing protein [Magnetococcales bacterium]
MTARWIKRLLVLVLVVGVLVGWREAFRPGYFPVKGIRLHGVVNTAENEVISALQVPDDINILTLNPGKLREQLLEALPWVRQARVERLLPSTLIVKLEEKVPVCLTRRGDQLWLLDEYGQPIKELRPTDPYLQPIVYMVGGDIRAESVVRIMNLLGRHPWLRQQVAEVAFLPGERWAMYTRSGLKVLFSPAVESELLLLKRLQKKYRMLDRQIRQVDLRVAGLIAVRPAQTTGAM